MRRATKLIAVLFLVILPVAVDALAVAPVFWRVTAAEEFLAGELEGFAVNSRGELRAAPAMKKLASFTDPFVLSQTSAPNGDRYFGTGNDGKVYRLRGTTLEVVYTAPEPEIYAVAWSANGLVVASSPNGKLYRVNPDTKQGTALFDPQQAYIWAVEPAGNELLVATGVEGKLFRVTAAGVGTVLYDSPDTHVRSIAARPDGSVLAGASGKGRIYRVARDGSALALFDSPLNEISSIYIDAQGTGWASGVSNVLPSAAPAKTQAKPAQASAGSGSASADAPKEGESASGNVEVSFSFDDSAASAAAQSGTAEVYRIDPDGFVQTVRKFEREMIYGISSAANGGVLLATGPNGRVYHLQDGEVSLLGSVPEKQVVSISGSGTSPLITTTNTGAVYRMEAGTAETPEFRSAPKDAERFSRFGSYRIEGRNLSDGTVAIAFRSGNTRTPDATWSAWTPATSSLEGTVGATAARYLQWKLTMPKPAPAVAIDGVTVAYVNRNIAPAIEGLAVQDPAVVFISSAYPAAPQVVEATNPDEYGIFSSLDSPRERAVADQGKRMFRKGFRTVSWRATDENGDAIRYALSIRRKGDEKWLRLRDNMEETQINFDTAQLPDGRYELRLTATDALDNPDAPLTDSRDGVEFIVDNTAPVVRTSREGSAVAVRISDELSPVGRVEYSADAEKWIRITPEDGIADSREEIYRLAGPEIDGKFVIIRAVDGQYNVTTTSTPRP
jgi:outer membrane protein assembly factor BamB